MAVDRESIWSILKEAKHVYFTLFAVQICTALAMLLWGEAVSWDTFLTAWGKLGEIAMASAAIAIVVTELGGYLVVLAKDLEKRLEARRQRKQRERIIRVLDDHPDKTGAEIRRLIESADNLKGVDKLPSDA